MQRWLLLLAVTGTLLIGCVAPRYAVPRDLADADAMRALLAQEIPQGTSLSDAQTFMEVNQFTCQTRRGQSYTSQDFARENFDFLQCRRTDKAGFMVVRCWNIALVLEEDIVQDIYVDISYVGP